MAERKRKRGERFTARTKQRNRALDVIFEADERGLLEEESLRGLLAERKVLSTAQVPIGDFGALIVEAYADNSDDVDTLIEAASEDWALSRMNAVDRSILRAATAEMVHMGTSRAHAIPEWATLARAFSTDRSVGFVMGVLNRVADIRARETGMLGQDGQASSSGGRNSGAGADGEGPGETDWLTDEDWFSDDRPGGSERGADGRPGGVNQPSGAGKESSEEAGRQPGEPEADQQTSELDAELAADLEGDHGIETESGADREPVGGDLGPASGAPSNNTDEESAGSTGKSAGSTGSYGAEPEGSKPEGQA